MATKDRSPSLIIFQPWSALGDLTSPGTENDKEDAADKDAKGNSCGSMKLGKQDMSLFGFCPSRDEFSLVVCEKCNLLVKPQALKQHIESRHGLTNLSSLGSISASALNSELGKKLLMPLPIISNPLPASASSEKRASDTFKPLSAGRLPTKASLKQVPASVKNSLVPILSGGMKINITKPMKSGNRLTPAKAATISNPIVKVEKLDNISLMSSSLSNKPTAKQEDPEPPLSELSKNILNIDSTKISTLLNGSIKSAVSLTTPPSTLTTSASAVLSPVVTTAVTKASTAVTKASTDTLLSTRNVMFVSTALTKPQVITPVMTVGSNGSLAVHHVTSAKNMKLSKDHRERKLLPCKDREYDANKHCGVPISETGKPCTRSLTCKTHALSLRRAVAGRSKSFDGLLKEHKAVKDAILKAKAGAQRGATSSGSMTYTHKGLISSVTTNSALNVVKQQMTPVMSFQSDGNLPHSGCSPGATRTIVSSNSMSTTATPFVKPHCASNMFQRFTSSVMHPTITVKEETTGSQQESTSRLSVSPEVSQAGVQDLKHDHNFMSHHPRPLSCNNFGGRLSDRSCTLFSRKMDYVRAALLSALQRQLNPPPHKKLCVESNLPKETQVFNNCQDPYEFKLPETSGSGDGGGSVSPALASPSKPVLKPKSKLAASPVAASSFYNQSLNLCSGTVSSALPSSASPVSTLSATPIEAPSVSTSNIALNWLVKPWDEVTTRNSSASPSTTLSSTQVINPGSRKRSGSSTSLNGQLMTLTNGNGTLPINTPASLTMTLTTNNFQTTSGGTGQQTGLIGVITPTHLNSLQAGNLIAIPNVSLCSSGCGQQNTSSSCTAKITSAAGGASHKNIFKDFNFVLTGIDSSLVNGQQYVNISSAQLAELTKIQGQTLFLNNFSHGDPNSSSTSSSIHSINRAGSLPTSRPAKRSRNSGSKPHPVLTSSDRKIATSALETYKLVPSSSLQPTTVLMDGSLQDAMLTLATGSSAPTLVALTSSTDSANSAMMMGNSSQVLCADTTSVINSSALVNGISQSTRDNSGSINQHHHHSTPSKSHHHHHHHHHHRPEHSNVQQQQDIFVGSVLQSAPSVGSILQSVPSVAIPISSAAATQLCSSQTLFKPHETLNLAAKNLAGKLTMQPMSLTFPISVSQAGLAALTSGKPQQLQPQHQQQAHHALSVASDGVGTGDPSTTVLVAGKTDLHLQSQISGTSTSSLIS